MGISERQNSVLTQICIQNMSTHYIDNNLCITQTYICVCNCERANL